MNIKNCKNITAQNGPYIASLCKWFMVRLYDIKEVHNSWKDKYRQEHRKEISRKDYRREKIQCLNNWSLQQIGGSLQRQSFDN